MSSFLFEYEDIYISIYEWFYIHRLLVTMDCGMSEINKHNMVTDHIKNWTRSYLLKVN
jgi:hypothetical protein